MGFLRNISPSDPLGSSKHSFLPLGGGEHATIFRHPSSADLAIRISNDNDGWLFYARRVRNVLRTINYGPRLLAIQRIGDKWVSVTDSLRPVSSRNARYLPVLREILAGNPLSDEQKDMRVDIRKQHQDIDWFISNYLKGADSLKDDDFMERGGKIVFNDPYAEMSGPQRIFMNENYAPSAAQVSA